MKVENGCIEEEEHDVSTQFLQTKEIDFLNHLERYCHVLPVFGFNSAKYEIYLLKSYLLTLLVDERGIEPILKGKANHFVSFKI